MKWQYQLWFAATQDGDGQFHKVEGKEQSTNKLRLYETIYSRWFWLLHVCQSGFDLDLFCLNMCLMCLSLANDLHNVQMILKKTHDEIFLCSIIQQINKVSFVENQTFICQHGHNIDKQQI